MISAQLPSNVCCARKSRWPFTTIAGLDAIGNFCLWGRGIATFKRCEIIGGAKAQAYC